MNIAVDCRMLHASGVGAFLRGILPWLLKSPHHFLLIGDKVKINSFLPDNNVQIIDCSINAFSINELFFFPKKTVNQINHEDVFFSPFFNFPGGITIPVYTTIHDIIFPDMPKLVSKTGLAARMFFFRRAYKKSVKIFTVSKFSKSRIEYHLGKTKPVVVANSGIQPSFPEYRANVQNVQKKRTIIFIGNIKKHKGLDYLLDAFIIAKKEGLQHKLIIVGSMENFRTSDNSVIKKIDAAGPDAVSFTGFISDEQLMKYLCEASLLVQPSLYEGFGLPPLEAMVLGTHVLISDIPVFREIYADYPVTFFQAGNTLDLKNKMTELLQKENIEPLVLSKELTEKYNFKKTASIVLKEMAF